jgi:hypothetical protein
MSSIQNEYGSDNPSNKSPMERFASVSRANDPFFINTNRARESSNLRPQRSQEERAATATAVSDADYEVSEANATISSNSRRPSTCSQAGQDIEAPVLRTRNMHRGIPEERQRRRE